MPSVTTLWVQISNLMQDQMIGNQQKPKEREYKKHIRANYTSEYVASILTEQPKYQKIKHK